MKQLFHIVGVETTYTFLTEKERHEFQEETGLSIDLEDDPAIACESSVSDEDYERIRGAKMGDGPDECDEEEDIIPSIGDS